MLSLCNGIRILKLVLGTHLFVRVPYLDQETAKKSFRFSSQTATCYYQSIHS